jgi:uncharacterized protein (TIGR03000 family)
MYSVVLMAALTTTTADVPSFGWRGCHGGWGWNGCHGCNGGCGGCHGWRGCCGCNGGYSGCNGCYGGCYGGGYGGCAGWYVGYTGCIGGCHSNYAPVPPGHPVPPSGKPAEKIQKPSEEIKKEGSAAKDAKLIVDLPPDAKLFIDDQPMKVTSQHVIFMTPELQLGKTYYYDVRAEIVQDGKVVSDTKRVVFHAGDDLKESFARLGTATTEKVAADK